MVAQGRVSAGEAPHSCSPSAGGRRPRRPLPLPAVQEAAAEGARETDAAPGRLPAAALLFRLRSVFGCRQKRLHAGEWGQGPAKHMSVGC